MSESKTYIYTYTSPDYDKTKPYIKRELNITHKLTEDEKKLFWGNPWKRRLKRLWTKLKEKLKWRSI